MGSSPSERNSTQQVPSAVPRNLRRYQGYCFPWEPAVTASMVVVSPANVLVPVVSAASLGFLALLGAIGARAGGANVWRATARVTFWGALAMALTAGIGKLFGTVV